MDFIHEHKVQVKDQDEIYNVNHLEEIDEDNEDIVEKNCSYFREEKKK